MTGESLLGALILAMPLLVAFWIMFRKRQLVFWSTVAMLVVGLGYLVATGAAADLGRLLIGPSSAPKVAPAKG
jgi:hypothetical protein